MIMPFVVTLGLLLIPMGSSLAQGTRQRQFIGILLFSYILRLFIFMFISREVSFFSHGTVVCDSGIYEYMARSVINVWHQEGLQWITDDNIVPGIRKIALPVHLIAIALWPFDGNDPFPAVAVVAFLACISGIVVYKFALSVGSSESAAFRAFLLTMFGPSFLYHTSDTYKDGINALFVLLAVYFSSEVSRKFSILTIIGAIGSLVGIYFVRPYMVVACALPLLLGLIGIRSKISMRTVMAILGLSVITLASTGALIAQTEFVNETAETFEQATSRNVIEGNADGGSGVTFDDGGNPFAALPQKILYTLLSPFPWMSGSLGLQLGKIETALFYYFLWSSYMALRKTPAGKRGTLFLLLSFVLPTTLAYATTMANIGLIVRQRMPIVMVTCVMASLYWTHRERVAARREATSKGSSLGRALRGAAASG